MNQRFELFHLLSQKGDALVGKLNQGFWRDDTVVVCMEAVFLFTPLVDQIIAFTHE